MFLGESRKSADMLFKCCLTDEPYLRETVLLSLNKTTAPQQVIFEEKLSNIIIFKP